MWSLIKLVLLRIAAVRLLFRLFGGLVLVPVAFLLKVIGVPLLIVLAVLALPVFFVLFILGLPVFMVLIGGGAVLALLAASLSIGAVVLKVALFVVLPVWLVWRLARACRGCRRRDEGGSGASPQDAAA